MGSEFGQTSEWNFKQSLDWHLLEFAPHHGMKECVKGLNHLYKNEPALFEHSFSHDGFEWIDTQDRENSILVYARKGINPDDTLVVVLNLTPVPRHGYRVGVPMPGEWSEVFTTDASEYYGSGIKNTGLLRSENELWHGKQHSIRIEIPPLGAVLLKKVR